MQPQLGDLLGGGEKFATFHDASLVSVHVDYGQSLWLAEFTLYVGDPDSGEKIERERQRRGRLRIEGLKMWMLEAPGPGSTSRKTGLWLTDDGPLDESPTETGRTLALAMDPDTVGWWLFFSDLNAFGYVAGDVATFHWL